MIPKFADVKACGINCPGNFLFLEVPSASVSSPLTQFVGSFLEELVKLLIKGVPERLERE